MEISWWRSSTTSGTFRGSPHHMRRRFGGPTPSWVRACVHINGRLSRGTLEAAYWTANAVVNVANVLDPLETFP